MSAPQYVAVNQQPTYQQASYQQASYQQQQQQPMYQQPPVVYAIPPAQVIGVPAVNYHMHHAEWRADLCDCCDSFVNMLMSWFCPCVVLAQISSRLGHAFGGYCCVLLGMLILYSVHNSFVTLADDDWALISNMRNVPPSLLMEAFHYQLMAAFCTLLTVIFVAMVRSRVRRAFRIPGSECEDFCLALCCQCCTIAQLSTQVGVYEAGECSCGPRDTLPAYYVTVPLH
ncbi:Aste57867_9080 [Aphanomyces stellatus]|uniref:Aste57867_9080 protein n=1 Tax=Aphanomyces stellatus TaxID=120398 RepID=A0A485KLW3_9STRA|nr:hypothetical protein As57867_009044 [Aphanomyces stellatus]VFT85964.1 Aste57867_9080 [Aphanomyces stellatus]